MKYDFDQLIDRYGIGASKYLSTPRGFIPMSLADMDFLSPPEVLDALRQRGALGEVGGGRGVEEDYAAIIDFVKWRHGVEIPRKHLVAGPGVLYMMRAAMYMLTKPGDRVVVPLPLHTPSIATAGLQGRVPCYSWMRRRDDGNYTFDLDDLERHFKAGARLLLLCNPHNPTGRVWTRDELEDVAGLAKTYDVTVVSDEVHRDLAYDGHPHTSMASLPGMAERAISVFSTSKTFNFGGFQASSAVVANEDYRRRLVRKLYEYGHYSGRPGLFSIVAQTAAYRHGRPWLTELISVLERNADIAMDYLKDLPMPTCRPEASFILWVDCSALKFDTAGLRAWLTDAQLKADPGHYYEMADIADYNGPQNHVRLTFGLPRSVLETGMERFRNAVLRRLKTLGQS